MRSGKFFLLLLLLLVTAGCGGSSSGSTASKSNAVKVLASLAIAPSAPKIALGTTQAFTVTGTYTDNSTADLTGSVTWSSSATSVATIGSSAGSVVATGLGVGQTTITATLGDITASTTLTVTGASLVSITVAPGDSSLALGLTRNFTASGTFSDSTTQDVTDIATWSSSAPGVATISNSAGTVGQATAAAVGTTTITATVTPTAGSVGIVGSTTLTVTAATLTSVAITPTNPTLALGGTQQFTATGTFTDRTTRDLTSSVTWSSSNTNVATISNAAGSNGKATPVAAGTVTITAAMAISQPLNGTISISTQLTVSGTSSTSNVVAITVNGSLCSSGSYPNKPCVSVTVCTPGTSNCQTITDILLDTGSTGLRVFKQALSVTLPQVTVGSRSLAECIQYADGSSNWGPVQTASVTLGGEPAVQVPIQVIDSTFGTRSRACQSADLGPSDGGFNGILGVGLFAQDCGSACAGSSNIGLYYGCSGSTCTGTTVPLSTQVQNPVALLPQDNNGVLVQLPSVSTSGATSVSGSLILGIGTRANNSSTSVTTFPADSLGEFTTTFNGSTLSNSFIDSGSNALFFDYPSFTTDSTGTWYTPSSATPLSAVNTGAFGSPSLSLNFTVANATSLFHTGNNVFNDLGGSGLGGFDWGLPFFLGRNVFVGIEGTTSPLGTGPFWAY
ncbi:DUF3443 family protein [Geomesophilobacter sediminis]|uniref:DUF3443 family protein n=1 Tax=Geomesophilobacter sediminis TaxID=2798584 RepID=A0A8J7M285_9BACT|nr:DUF3443 family protein [Geomesophilobacter sediminis]MBJ6727384.1 DUF3443 family protein [Geomesophilobacter sediminis]